MPAGFPPVPLYPLAFDNDYTLYLVYNTTEANLTLDNTAWAEEISLEAAAGDEVWADNGFANLNGELMYYDAVEKIDGKVTKLKRVLRGLNGYSQFNATGEVVRSFVVAEHHNQVALATIKTEGFVGENFSEDQDTLDYRIRHLADQPIIFNDFACPDVQFNYNVISEDPNRGTLISYSLVISGVYGSAVIDFGDGTTTSAGSGTHQYSSNANIDPVVTVSNDDCQIVQTPIVRDQVDAPAVTVVVPPFTVGVPIAPSFPTFVFPSTTLPSTDIIPPAFVAPCIDLSPLNSLPSVLISMFGSLPSAFNIGNLVIPSLISFANFPSIPPISFLIPSLAQAISIVIPSIITFTNVPSFPTTINFGPAPSFPTTISFANIPSFPTTINFTNVPSFPGTINFINPPSIPATITFVGNPVVPSIINFGTFPVVPSIEFGPFPVLPSIEFGPLPSLVINFGTLSIPVISLEFTFPEFPPISFVGAPSLPEIITFANNPQIPSRISFFNLPTIPNFISFGPAPTIPSLVSFANVPSFPSTISFGPAPGIPSVISFTQTSIPTRISIDCCSFPSVISFGTVPAFPRISFATPPTVSVAWGTPPTLSCVVSVLCPTTTPMAMTARNMIDPGLGDVEIQYDIAGIPSVISIVAPNRPIRVESAVPSVIRIERPDFPVIRMLGPEVPIPTVISIIAPAKDEIPSVISVAFPSVISVEAVGMPTSLRVEFPADIPTMKVDASDIPRVIRVLGMPESIKIEHDIPSRIVVDWESLPMPAISLAPVEVKVNLAFDKLAVGESEDLQCFTLVPCKR